MIALRIHNYLNFYLHTSGKDDVLDDAEYEKGILESTKIYEVELDEDENAELVLLDEYSGKVPSKKWLSSDKVFIDIC